MLTRNPDNQGPKPKRLLDQVRDALRRRHYSYRTEQASCDWIKRCVSYHQKRHPREMGEAEVEQFLSHLAADRRVSASMQNQALCALLFLYRHVIGVEMAWINAITWAKKQARVPIVLSRAEVAAILARLSGRHWLMASLMHGTGLRLMECLRLRVQAVDFDDRQIVVVNGKGAKDRSVPLPDSLVAALKQEIAATARLLESDLADGFGEVLMPESLVRKTPSAPFDLRLWYVLPAHQRSVDPMTRRVKRHHVLPSVMRKAMRAAVQQAGIAKRAKPHTLRHSFQHICWRRATTSTPSRSCWATAM